MDLDFALERDELAGRLGGGLPQGSLCLVEGEGGSGKSVLTQRIAYGLLEHGHRTVFVSSEFSTPAFLDQMQSLGYPVMDAFADGRLLFVPTNPLLGHSVSSRERLPRLLAARHLLRQPVVIVDVFSMLAEPHLRGPGGDRRLEHLVRSLKQINATGTTLVLTIDPAHFEGLDASALASAADVRLECRTERTGGQVNRFIVTRKFARAGGAVGDIIPFRVEPGAGFIVEIRAVA